MRSLLCLLALMLVLPLPARAQLPGVFEGLFDNVNSIVFYTQVGALTDNSDIEGTVADFGVTGLGTEVLIELPEVFDTDFELGLGTSFVRGFQSTEPSLDLRASIRTLPQISVWASGFGGAEQGALNPYIGLSFGVSDLWNARAYDPNGAVYDLGAETFDLALTAGLYVEAPLVRGLYIEGGYRLRRFESITWETAQLPPNWPRAIDASMAFINLGWQFRLRPTDKDSDGDE